MDGASKENDEGGCGGGGIIRDKNGKCKGDFSKNIGIYRSLWAKL